ncbi:MAG: 16S rRNA (uracil(1498)-N(3))-methyltransferase [Steroidobacteraceae bacterium]
MRLTRIYVDAPLAAGAAVSLPAAPAQHLTRVLRLQVGATLRAFNGRGGEFDAVIESVQRDAVLLRLGAYQHTATESPLQVTLLQGIARGEKMDLILQKATELGVTAVVPVSTARSTVKLDEHTSARKMLHWQGVVIGACEQSGRERIPTVASPAGLATAVEASAAQLKLLLVPEAAAGTLKTLLAAASAGSSQAPSICLLVGPEGGLDSQEVQLAKNAGFQSCQLGPRVLRTETAALTALAALQSLAGDLT